MIGKVAGTFQVPSALYFEIPWIWHTQWRAALRHGTWNVPATELSNVRENLFRFDLESDKLQLMRMIRKSASSSWPFVIINSAMPYENC